MEELLNVENNKKTVLICVDNSGATEMPQMHFSDWTELCILQ